MAINRQLECIQQQRKNKEKKQYQISYHEGDVFQLLEFDDNLQAKDQPEDLLKNDITSIQTVPDLVNQQSVIINEVQNQNSDTAQEIMQHLNQALHTRQQQFYQHALDELLNVVGSNLDEQLKEIGSEEIQNFIDFVEGNEFEDEDDKFDLPSDQLNGFESTNPADQILIDTAKIRVQQNTPETEEIKQQFSYILQTAQKKIPEFVPTFIDFISQQSNVFKNPSIKNAHPQFIGNNPANGLDFAKYFDQFNNQLSQTKSQQSSNPSQYANEQLNNAKEAQDKIKEFTKKIEEFINKIFKHTKDVKEQDQTSRELMETMKCKNNEMNQKLVNTILKKLKEFIEEQMQKVNKPEKSFGGLNDFANQQKAIKGMLQKFLNINEPLNEDRSMKSIAETAAQLVDQLMGYVPDTQKSGGFVQPNNKYISSKYTGYQSGKQCSKYTPTYSQSNEKVPKIRAAIGFVDFINDLLNRGLSQELLQSNTLQKQFSTQKQIINSGEYEKVQAYQSSVVQSNLGSGETQIGYSAEDTFIDTLSGGLVSLYSKYNNVVDLSSKTPSADDLLTYLNSTRLGGALDNQQISAIQNGIISLVDMFTGPKVDLENMDSSSKATIMTSGYFFKHTLDVPSEVAKFINKVVIDMLANLFTQMSNSTKQARKEFDDVEPLQLKVASKVSESISELFSNSGQLINQLLNNNSGGQEQESQPINPKNLKYAMNAIVSAFGLLGETLSKELKFNIGNTI